MAVMIGVRFRDVGKVYDFDPGEERFQVGDRVIVETSRGIECGEVVIPNREEPDEALTRPLKRVIRRLSEADARKLSDNTRKEKDAFTICQEKIRKHGLEMKLIDVEYTFDGSKIIFSFTADGRVDFRELVKDLASVFRTRIELRQIGVRDEAKLLGGLGICGKPFCCATFLGEFQPVSIKMAKEQGLSLSPTKISGSCGRLMCCLKYEQEAYEDLLKITPRIGSIVETAEGVGTVIDLNILTGILKVRLDETPDAPVNVHRSEVSLLQAGKGRRRRTSEPGRPASAPTAPAHPTERLQPSLEDGEIEAEETVSWLEEAALEFDAPPSDEEAAAPAAEAAETPAPRPKRRPRRGGRGRRGRSKSGSGNATTTE